MMHCDCAIRSERWLLLSKRKPARIREKRKTLIPEKAQLQAQVFGPGKKFNKEYSWKKKENRILLLVESSKYPLRRLNIVSCIGQKHIRRPFVQSPHNTCRYFCAHWSSKPPSNCFVPLSAQIDPINGTTCLSTLTIMTPSFAQATGFVRHTST